MLWSIKMRGNRFQKRKDDKRRRVASFTRKNETMDPDDNEMYKFLGVEPSDGIKKKNVMVRVKIELIRRLELLTKTELNDENVMTATRLLSTVKLYQWQHIL